MSSEEESVEVQKKIDKVSTEITEMKEELPNISVQNDGSSDLTDIEEKIIKQVEYYFGDFNLRKDKFLKEQIKLDNGWISLETLIKFNRLKAITTDFQQIVIALKKSPNKLIEVNCDMTKIRRNPEKPIVENGSYEEEKLKERCVYVKKFPESITLDELQEFFKNFGTTENILMRRYQQTKQFRGSVFVTFSTKDDADKFMKLTSVKYNNTELSRETREEYSKRKEVQFNKYKEQKEKKLKEKEAIKNEMEKEKIMRGCLLKLTGVTDELNWEKLKTFFNLFASVAFVDFDKNKNEAILRFSNEGDAKLALEKAIAANEENKLIVSNVELSGSVIEGEEEEKYWESFKQLKAEKFNRNHQKGKKGKRGRYDNHSRGRNNKSGEDSSEHSPQKKLKTEG